MEQHTSVREPATADLSPDIHSVRQNRVRRILVLVFTLAVTAATLFVAPKSAEAHNWGNYHWDRSGSKVSIYVWDQTGGCGTGGNATNDSLYDVYYNPHPLWIYCVGDHTDISMWETNRTDVWWCGLATIWAYSNGHITHGHAQTNLACGTAKNTKQGTHCQEFVHTLGMDHSDTGDCMGLSYFSGSNGRYYIGSTGAYVYDWDHQSVDLYYKYRYSHH